MSGITYTAGSTQLGNLTYSYDADGRRTATSGSLAAVSLPAALSSATYNAGNEQTKFGGTSLSYDSAGQLTGDGTNTYTWDARHHLTQIAQGKTTTASFVYDAFGRRASKTISGATTQFLYDGLNPVQELAAGNPPASVTANLLTGLGIDEYFSRSDASGTMAFLRDALGSTIGLVNSAGGIDTSYTYEPFGNTTVNGGNANPYQFTGRENDGTGLYFYRARYYSPTFQRFMSQDPIGFAGGDPSLYGYVRDNPVVLVDPSGLYTIGLGISLGFNFGGWVNINFSGGIVSDTYGNIGFYFSTAGGYGVGSNVSGGLTVSASNAKTICDLRGPFGEVNSKAGEGLGYSLSGFSGSSPDGTVVGGALTLGGDLGASYGVGASSTAIWLVF